MVGLAAGMVLLRTAGDASAPFVVANAHDDAMAAIAWPFCLRRLDLKADMPNS